MKFDQLIKFLEEDFISPFVSRSQNVAATGGQSGGDTRGSHEMTFPNKNTGMVPISPGLFPKVKKLDKLKKKVKKKCS